MINASRLIATELVLARARDHLGFSAAQWLFPEKKAVRVNRDGSEKRRKEVEIKNDIIIGSSIKVERV